MQPLICLTTDFGLRDAYVPAMKGVMLSLCPDVRFLDVSHTITPHDVMEAAFVLRGFLPHAPAGAVHLVVIDPGVGTDRRPVAIRHGEHRYVGPDNGLFPLALGVREPDEVVVLDRPEAWRVPEPSRTFHGRDVFAPVAARLAAGAPLSAVGTPTDRLTPLQWALPIADDQGIRGWVVHVDRFGNCITNIPRPLLDQHRNGRAIKCYAGGAVLHGVQPTYGAVPAGEPLALYGSDDHLEIAVHGGNASELLGIRKGAAVNLVFADAR